MSKSAMQELIEYLEKSYYITKYTNFDKDKIQFLEKEKEQIMNAYWEGGQDVPTHSSTVDEYYNQTYNQNK
jgi:hypothetical protein